MAERRLSAPEFYVYVIFRLDGRPCYVGKGRGDRWYDHECASRHKSTPFRKIIDEAKAAGVSLPKVKIAEGLTEAEAFEIEAAFISAIGRKRYGGPLVNLTDGGEGNAGKTYTSATIAKMSAAKRGRKLTAQHRANIAAAGLGRKQSDETRQKLKEALTGKKRGPLSEAVLLRRKAGNNPGHTGYAHTPEAREKMSAALKGKGWSAARRAAQERKSRPLQGVLNFVSDNG